jgi:hypothetical protein
MLVEKVTEPPGVAALALEPNAAADTIPRATAAAPTNRPRQPGILFVDMVFLRLPVYTPSKYFVP